MTRSSGSPAEDPKQRTKREDELRALPGFNVWQHLRSLRRCHRIMQTNHAELLAHLGRLDEDGAGALMGQAFDPFMEEVERLLGNFLASAGMLRDHIYASMRDIFGADSDFETKQYAAAAADIAADPACQFLQQLRNYQLHYRLPRLLLAAEYEFTASGDNTVTIVVGSEPGVDQIGPRHVEARLNLLVLRRADALWSGEPKRFVNATPDAPLVPLLERRMVLTAALVPVTETEVSGAMQAELAAFDAAREAFLADYPDGWVGP